jgi:hypothetical protein
VIETTAFPLDGSTVQSCNASGAAARNFNPDQQIIGGVIVRRTPPMPSTLIKRIEYNSDTRILSVEFLPSGLVYNYDDVPPATYEAFRTAFANGRFFNRFIRGRFASHIDEPGRPGADNLASRSTLGDPWPHQDNHSAPDYRKSRVFTLIASMCRSGM